MHQPSYTSMSDIPPQSYKQCNSWLCLAAGSVMTSSAGSMPACPVPMANARFRRAQTLRSRRPFELTLFTWQLTRKHMSQQRARPSPGMTQEAWWQLHDAFAWDLGSRPRSCLRLKLQATGPHGSSIAAHWFGTPRASVACTCMPALHVAQHDMQQDCRSSIFAS